MPFPSEAYPTVNGAVCAWAQLTVKLMGDRVVGLQKASWKHSLERKPVYGRGLEPIGFTEASYKAEAAVELLFSDSQYLKGILRDVAGLGFFQQVFQSTLHYKLVDGPEYLIALVDCYINESGSDASAGSGDQIIVPHPLTVRRIIEDGKYGVQQAA